jgi:hypothetical protein
VQPKGSRLLAVVFGALTGSVVGSVLVVLVCQAIESQTGQRFTKEPLVGIIFVGVPVGAIVGAAVGRWTIRRPPDQPGQPNPSVR